MKFKPSRSPQGKTAAMPGGSPAVLECAVRGDGELEVVYAARTDRALRLRLVDDHGQAHELSAVQDEPLGMQGVELLDRASSWRFLEGDKRAKLGTNFSAAFTLEDADTWFVRGPAGSRSVAVALADPAAKGKDTPVAGGVPYRFEVLASAHRCRAELKLSLLDAKGRALETLTRGVAPSAVGGRERAGYDRLSVAFRAPKAAHSLRVALFKSEAAKGQDSFLFFAAPSLMQDEGEVVAVSLPDHLSAGVRAAELAGLSVRRAVAPLAKDMAGPDERLARLELHADDRLVASGEVRLRQPRALDIDRFHFEHGGVRITGHVARPAEAGTLRLHVDGRPGMAADLSREGPLDQILFVERDLLDGAMHRIEVRNDAGEALFFDRLITPGLVNPLEAGQAYDRAHEADERRVLGLRKWMEQANAGAKLPDLAHLQRVLDGQTEARPKLVFPIDADPRITVILRVSGEAEAAYASLAGLLFAANDAPFRVVVVAAGKTAGLTRLASGVVFAAPAKGADHNAAVDAVVAASGTEHVVVLDEGYEPVSGWLDELLAAFANFDGIGLAGAQAIGADGRLEGGANPYEPGQLHLREVEAVHPLMATRAVWKAAGGLGRDWAHPAYAEADLARRVHAHGLRVVAVPTAQVWALPQVASAQPDEEERRRFRVASHGVRRAPATFRVLFIDQEAPTIDFDAGGYAAFQEIRMLQAMGAEVTFLPRNLAWMDRHTRALERAGVRCLYSPFVRDFRAYVREHAGDYDLAYVTRYKVALDILDDLKSSPHPPKIALVLADLHFLREIREAAAGTAGYTLAKARETQEEELRAIAGCDLTLSYSEVEMAVIESHTFGQAKVARLPWVAEPRSAPIGSYAGSGDLLFLGGFGHPPNVDAVKVFVGDVMPKVTERLPRVKLRVVGSKAPQEVLDLASDSVEVVGYVPDLDDAFASARVFVAPLLAGAGIKGKVIEAMALGVPSVLSPVAAEATGLTDGVDCRIARTPDEWATAIAELYGSRKIWDSSAEAALAAARRRFSFAAGVAQMREALGMVGVYGPTEGALVFRTVRPDRYV